MDDSKTDQGSNRNLLEKKHAEETEDDDSSDSTGDLDGHKTTNYNNVLRHIFPNAFKKKLPFGTPKLKTNNKVNTVSEVEMEAYKPNGIGTAQSSIDITLTKSMGNNSLPNNATRLFNRIETDNTLPTIPVGDLHRNMEKIDISADIKEEEVENGLYEDMDGNMTIHTFLDHTATTRHDNDDQISFGDTTVLQQPVPDSLPASQSRTPLQLGSIIGHGRKLTNHSSGDKPAHVITPTPTANGIPLTPIHHQYSTHSPIDKLNSHSHGKQMTISGSGSGNTRTKSRVMMVGHMVARPATPSHTHTRTITPAPRRRLTNTASNSGPNSGARPALPALISESVNNPHTTPSDANSQSPPNDGYREDTMPEMTNSNGDHLNEVTNVTNTHTNPIEATEDTVTAEELLKREFTMESSNIDVRKGSFGAVCDKCGTYHAPDVTNCQAFIKFNVTHSTY